MFLDAGWDANLDEAQLAAVVHGDDPLVIVAGAGTGKTRTLTIAGGPAPRAWCGSREDPAVDLHTACGRRHARSSRRPERTPRVGATPAWGHFSRRRAPAHQQLRRAARAATGVLAPRPRGRRRCDGPAERRARPRRGRRQGAAVSHARRGVLAVRQHPAPLERGVGDRFPMVRAAMAMRSPSCSRRTSLESARGARSISTTCCCCGERRSQTIGSGRT